jgi:hypothetical protein
VIDFPVRLIADSKNLQTLSSKIQFQLTAQDNAQLTVTEEARFLGPVK